MIQLENELALLERANTSPHFDGNPYLRLCRRYYSDSLPRLLDGLQRSEEQRIEVLRSSVMSCVAKEREVSPIIAKCHDTIAAAMHAVDPAKVNNNYISSLYTHYDDSGIVTLGQYIKIAMCDVNDGNFNCVPP